MKEKWILIVIYFKVATAVNLHISLKQIKLPMTRYTCAPIYKLPSNISTIVGLEGLGVHKSFCGGPQT